MEIYWNKYIVGKTNDTVNYEGKYNHLFKETKQPCIIIHNNLKCGTFHSLNNHNIGVYNYIIQRDKLQSNIKTKLSDNNFLFVREILDETEDCYYIIGSVISDKTKKELEFGLSNMIIHIHSCSDQCKENCMDNGELLITKSGRKI